VIYVMGAGRSGRTILDGAVGDYNQVFFAGELDAWLRRSGIPNFSGVDRTRFWNEVSEQVLGDYLYGDDSWRYLEDSLASLRIGGWPNRRSLRSRYRQVARDLYRAIATTAGATHIIDTSHYPLRARELRLLRDVDVYLLYLVRNPHDVVASFSRRDITNLPKSLVGTNVYLFLTHLLSTYVFLRHPTDRRLLVRYEDLIAGPEATIARILKWAGILSASSPDLEFLDTGMPFQGNRVLESNSIALSLGR
jgi:Sulfotransferase family